VSKYATGDTHGHIDIERLSNHKWEIGRTLTKSDYLIITGDLGLVWGNIPSKTELYWLKWLNDRKWTTLFIDGNHENFARLFAYPQVEMFGGTVGQIADSIFHLRRGQVYTIEGSTFWCFGGARS
jgi:hypothetical protein